MVKATNEHSSIIGGSCHRYKKKSLQKFCCDKHVFVATKHVFCREKSMLVVTKVLSRKYYVSRDKIFLSRQIFVATSINFVDTSILLSRQTQNTYFVPTKDVFCRDKHIFVATKMILVAALKRPHA